MLVGENGSGKTTVLQAIAMVMGGADVLQELLDDVDSWIRGGANDAEILAEIETAKGASRSIAVRMKRGDTAGAVV